MRKISVGIIATTAVREFFFWLVFIGTNWWPENIVTCKIRGFLVGKFFRRCGRNFQVGRNFRIINPHNMDIGDNVYIAQDAWINAKGGVVLLDSVTIGPRCSLVTTFHKNDAGQGFSHKIGAGDQAPIVVGEGTWLAINAVVRHGITIGKRCVVAANTVVTKDIPDDSVVGGVPARLIKSST